MTIFSVIILISVTFCVCSMFSPLVAALVGCTLLCVLIGVPVIQLSSQTEPKTFIKEFKVLHQSLAKLRKEEYLASHDLLTGLYDRNYLSQMIPTYDKTGKICVVFFDLNNLKQMNDTYGHAAGDALLKSAAAQLAFWKPYGDVFRIGGDEFIVVITNKPSIECEDLLQLWGIKCIRLNRASDIIDCRLSYGMAFGDSLEDTMKRADASMYEMKRATEEGNVSCV